MRCTLSVRLSIRLSRYRCHSMFLIYGEVFFTLKFVYVSLFACTGRAAYREGHLGRTDSCFKTRYTDTIMLNRGYRPAIARGHHSQG